jgi:predicted RNase H-like nuclease
VRGVLAAADYPQALRINRGSSPAAPGLSKQCWNIVARIREADATLTPAMQARVAEVHPEVSFVALAGRDALPPKKSGEGQRLRMGLLRAAGFPVAALLGSVARAAALPDDVLDACAAAWSARRIAAGEAWVLPSEGPPPRDSRGLEMAIRA